MSVSLREVLEHSGYDITTVDDARWLWGQRREIETLMGEAETTLQLYDDFLEDQRQDAMTEAREQHQEIWGDEEL